MESKTAQLIDAYLAFLIEEKVLPDLEIQEIADTYKELADYWAEAAEEVKTWA